jgi:hypothetical protein
MKARNQIYQRTPGNKPGRSVFDLSHEVKLSADFGQLIPILCEDVVPGDVFELGNELIVRLNPLVAPILHEINAYVHTFYVPNRILMDEGQWHEFISKGPDGEDDVVLPLWQPSTKNDPADWRASAPVGSAKGSLWDYLGLPTNIIPHVNCQPQDFPRRAYNKIWNWYYRDQDLQAEVAESNEAILRRSWEKDRFTVARPWQQRGTAPSLPVSGLTSAEWPAIETSYQYPMYASYPPKAPYDTITKSTLENNVIDLSVATSVNISDLRVAVQLQRWMELNARAGVRPDEFLQAHFGVSPKDERLQEPEYIGGMKAPIIVSEVLQTSQTDSSPQGNMAGHGIGVSQGYIGKYRVLEHGWIISLLSIMPRSMYQQGIAKRFLRRTPEEYFFPEYQHLSEDMIVQTEIYALDGTDNSTTEFGYQGRYDEYRQRDSYVTCDMRDTFDYWHMSRQFAAPPTLNATFIECVPRLDCFAVPTERPLIVSVGNLVKAIRPIAAVSDPGLMDHV